MERSISDNSEEGRRLIAAVESGAAREIGGVPPCREMKGLGWRVFALDGRIYALGCAMNDLYGWGYEISPENLSLFVEDADEARRLLCATDGSRPAGKETT